MMIYSTYTWDLVQALESASSASCKTPATFIDFIRPNDQPEKSKESRNEIHKRGDRWLYREKFFSFFFMFIIVIIISTNDCYFCCLLLSLSFIIVMLFLCLLYFYFCICFIMYNFLCCCYIWNFLYITDGFELYRQLSVKFFCFLKSILYFWRLKN